MANDPSGTLTFLFTDIEGSTRRWQEDAAAMRDVLRRHDAILADVIEGAGGRVFKHTGDGMCAAFSSVGAALGAAADVQRRMAGEDWGPTPLRVRAALHTGEASERDGDYFGPALNRVARIMAAGHGGQVLGSSTTASLVQAEGLAGVSLRDLGEHHLRDIAQPEHLFQLTAPGVESEFPPLRTGPTRSLPLSRSSFIGRATEIEELTQLLEKAPVVTLVGIGGTGKTRLALEVARRASERFEAVYFADLSSLAEDAQVPAALAAACGLVSSGPAGGPGGGGGRVIDVLIAAFAPRPTLLVLDNCEHLIEACAEMADELLVACPRLRVLATSREALSIEGERTWPVASLPTSESRELFVERATAVDPTFQLAPDNEESVDEICRRLDGIPLALELAAARIGPLTPAELAARLDDRFRLLTGGTRRRTQRQHTLRAAIDWSYDLLSPDEARLFRRLSVFSGGFTLEAAEAICADTPAERAAVLDVLSSLLAKSLVVATRTDAGTRYGMLETIRLYGADRLGEVGEVERRRDAHLEHWIEHAERHSLDNRLHDLAGAEELAALELDNVRAALDWSEAQGRWDRAAALALACAPLWFLTLHQDEGAARLTALQARPEIGDETRARILALLSMVQMTRGDFREMARSARRSLALETDSEWSTLAYSYAALYLSYAPDRYAEAHELLARGREVAMRHGNPRAVGLTHGIESHLFLMEGRLDEVVALARAVDRSPTFDNMNTLLAATVALLQADDPAAALDMAERLVAGGGEEWGGPLQALVLAENGRTEDARARMAQLVEIYLDRPFPLLVGDFLIALARVELDSDPELAAELLEAVVSERGPVSFRSPAASVLWSRVREQVRARLDESAFESARQRGSGLAAASAVSREAERLRRKPEPE